MKNMYIAVIIKEEEKFYSYGIKINSSDNLISKLKIKNIYSANVCDTKKKCSELVEAWNEQFKNNGKYMFSEAPFF